MPASGWGTVASPPRDVDPRAVLTEREQAVLDQMARGLSNNGIGARLYLSVKTVEAHIASIFRKLGLDPDAAGNRRVLAVLSWLRVSRVG